MNENYVFSSTEPDDKTVIWVCRDQMKKYIPEKQVWRNIGVYEKYVIDFGTLRKSEGNRLRGYLNQK